MQKAVQGVPYLLPLTFYLMPLPILVNLPLLVQAILCISSAWDASRPMRYVNTRTGVCGKL